MTFFGRIGVVRSAPRATTASILSARPATFAYSLCALLLGVAFLGAAVSFSPAISPAAELSANVTLDEADAVVRGHLERVKVLIANRQWDETIDTLRQVADQKGDKVIAVAPGYYVRIRDYCHRRLAALPSSALAAYRGQVDAQAEAWLQAAEKPADFQSDSPESSERSERLLRRIVDQFYASSPGDEALWRLGEYALERGDYGAARNYWEQLIETPPAVITDAAFDEILADKSLPAADVELLRRHYQRRDSRKQYELVVHRTIDPELMRLAALLRERGLTGPRAVYPAADQPPAAVFARLILVSILEGSTAWADAGLRDFAAVYPEARGRLGGREVNFLEALQALAAESRRWPRHDDSHDWPTFGGNFARNRIASTDFDVGRVKWRVPLSPVVPSTDSEQPLRRPTEDKTAALSYHPVVSGQQVFVHNGTQIFAYNLRTGGPAWGHDPVIYNGDAAQAESTFPARATLGVPRYTLSVHRRRLLARVGPPVTSAAGDMQGRSVGGAVVCLDLAGEGRLLWVAQPPEERWSYEGTPVADDEHVYVALRKGGVRPQMHIACLDAETGVPLWRRLICSAETPGQGQKDEITHNLLTLVGDSIYCNTNLGAVAALSKRDGEIRWITLYPRAGDDPNLGSHHMHRDLTPCVYDRGTLYVAPSDCPYILAIDAAGGLIRWESTGSSDAVHLLGVGGEFLYAAGDKLWCIRCVTGGIAHVWPDESPKGYGRGALVRNSVLWPTRTTLEAFSLSQWQQLREVELSTRDASGGNLIPAGDYLLIASGDELVAFDRYGGLQQAKLDADGETAAHGSVFQHSIAPNEFPAPRRRPSNKRNLRVQ